MASNNSQHIDSLDKFTLYKFQLSKLNEFIAKNNSNQFQKSDYNSFATEIKSINYLFLNDNNANSHDSLVKTLNTKISKILIQYLKYLYLLIENYEQGLPGLQWHKQEKKKIMAKYVRHLLTLFAGLSYLTGIIISIKSCNYHVQNDPAATAFLNAIGSFFLSLIIPFTVGIYLEFYSYKYIIKYFRLIKQDKEICSIKINHPKKIVELIGQVAILESFLENNNYSIKISKIVKENSCFVAYNKFGRIISTKEVNFNERVCCFSEKLIVTNDSKSLTVFNFEFSKISSRVYISEYVPKVDIDRNIIKLNGHIFDRNFIKMDPTYITNVDYDL